MSESSAISSGVAERYATAVFELARETGSIDTLESDIETLHQALRESDDLRHVIDSPIYSRAATQSAIGAVGSGLGLSEITQNTLKLMASKRRLFVLPAMLRHLRDMIAEEKGEVAADVTSAKPLTDEQRERLAATLKEKVGKDVKTNVAVDEDLIGGMVVKVGSRMIDTSIRTRLAGLRNAMREVG